MNDFLIRDARPEDLDFAFAMSVEAGHGFIERFLGCGSKDLAYLVFKLLWSGRPNRFHYTNSQIAESRTEKLGLERLKQYYGSDSPIGAAKPL